ncbi:MAG: DUF1684 domain-containing protein [Anaerolineales bacterium]|jgi:uncharacterized protein (DUF1684 family)
MDPIEAMRKEKDEFFANDPQSPLEPAQREDFKGLSYFPVNAGLRFELALEPVDNAGVIQMQTSTGDVQEYRRLGRIRFSVDGNPAQLTVFGDEGGYFIPFVDALAGKETYGAGRYLEPGRLSSGRLLIDFNLAYNAYCAYNHNWSCPIPPAENRLNVPIRAGEKLFSP